MANSFKEAAEKKRLEAERKKAEEEKKRLEKEKKAVAEKTAENGAQSTEEPPVVEETIVDPVETVEQAEESAEASEELSGGVSLDSLIGPAKKTQKAKKKTVAIYFSEENHKWLKKEADMRGKSVSAVLDEILTKLHS